MEMSLSKRGMPLEPEAPAHPRPQSIHLSERLALTPEETAKALGISRATCYRMLEDGLLRSVRTRRGCGRARIVVPLAAIKSYLGEENEVGAWR
jgi:excisionase family DNA binding protein